ncbi:UNVERIFIED_CONTAM: hypothetical protein RMT77_002687 [Armadillidium vulgare]
MSMNSKFTSKDFDPKVALANSSLKVDIGEEFEDLYKLRNSVHDQPLKAMKEDIEGVLGPGGIPIAKQPQINIQGHRHFHEDQGSQMIQKEKKILKNVLLRMEKAEGPLATLKNCKDSNTRVKVYTRNHICVRGIATGYVVAFDKYFNLVLRDVDEVFRKRIKCKTPSFDNVEKYVNVADLSIKDDYNLKDEPLVWRNPFRKPEGGKSVAGAYHDPPQPMISPPSSSSFISLTEGGGGRHFEDDLGSQLRHPYSSQDFESCSSRGVSVRDKKDESKRGERERKKTEGTRVIRDFLQENTSRYRDFHTLQSGQEMTTDRQKNSGNPGLCKGKGKDTGSGIPSSGRKPLQESREDIGETEELSTEEERVNVPVKRKRRRRKYEIRERHVKQLLIRGETVVLVQVLQV